MYVIYITTVALFDGAGVAKKWNMWCLCFDFVESVLLMNVCVLATFVLSITQGMTCPMYRSEALEIWNSSFDYVELSSWLDRHTSKHRTDPSPHPREASRERIEHALQADESLPAFGTLCIGTTLEELPLKPIYWTSPLCLRDHDQKAYFAWDSHGPTFVVPNPWRQVPLRQPSKLPRAVRQPLQQEIPLDWSSPQVGNALYTDEMCWRIHIEAWDSGDGWNMCYEQTL